MMKAVVFAVAASAVVASAPAFAGQSEYSFEVDASRAQTVEGAQAVYSDVQRQARRLCSEWDRVPTDIHRLEMKCRTEIVENAVATIDRPLVTAIHVGESPQRLAELSAVEPSN